MDANMKENRALSWQQQYCVRFCFMNILMENVKNWTESKSMNGLVEKILCIITVCSLALSKALVALENSTLSVAKQFATHKLCDQMNAAINSNFNIYF